jgi:hypothetical protein
MTVDHETLTGWFTRLKLTAICDQLDNLIDEAVRRELTLREALAFLCGREIARKDERHIEMVVKIAHFPCVRDLDGFDFAAQPSLDPRQIRELAACRWGGARRGAAPPGAARRWQDASRDRPRARRHPRGLLGAVRDRAGALVAALAKAHAEGRLDERLGFYAKPKMLIVDELGYLSFETSAAHLFFQLVSRRYERGRARSRWHSRLFFCGDNGTYLRGRPRRDLSQRRDYNSRIRVGRAIPPDLFLHREGVRLGPSHDSNVDRDRGRDRLPHPAGLNALQLVQGSVEGALNCGLIPGEFGNGVTLEQATKSRFERVVVTRIPRHYFKAILLPFVEKHLDAADAPEAPARKGDTPNQLFLELIDWFEGQHPGPVRGLEIGGPLVTCG